MASGREAGQAAVELVAALPAIVLAGLIALQLGLAGYSTTLADGAAEAGALALASGRPVGAAVREALPGWAGDRAEVEVHGGTVAVTLRPPSPFPMIADHLATTATGFARRAPG